MIRKLGINYLILEVKNVHLDKCADCFANKHERTSFRSRPPMRKKASLKLIHADVCYMDTKLHVGSQYFVTVLDAYSRKMWTFSLKMEDHVLSIFKEFQASTERETGRKLKAV